MISLARATYQMKPILVSSLLRFAAVALASTIVGCAAPGPAATNTGTSPAEPVAGEVLDADSYLLEQGDQIQIQVFDEPDLTMDQRVGASGNINYSYLGDLRVAGKTAQQLEREITGLLENGFLVNPSVNVTVLEYRPFFINGEVRSPGSYPYQPGLTLDKAIALAGGLTDRASTRKMSVQKASGDQPQGRAAMSTPIAPGDIISIEEGFF
jgi:polysaccharide export outer membrane protein